MTKDESPPAEAIAGWSQEQCAEAESNLAAYLSILREWDSAERMTRAMRLLESSSSDCSLEQP